MCSTVTGKLPAASEVISSGVEDGSSDISADGPTEAFVVAAELRELRVLVGADFSSKHMNVTKAMRQWKVRVLTGSESGTFTGTGASLDAPSHGSCGSIVVVSLVERRKEG